MPQATFLGGVINGTNGSGNVTVDFSTLDGGNGLQPGDVVLAIGGGTDPHNNPNPVTSGYDVHRQHIDTESGSANLGAFTKRMGATPDTKFIGAGSGSGIAGAQYAVYAWRDIDEGSVLDVAIPDPVETISGGPPDPGGLTTITNDAIVVAVVMRGAMTNPSSTATAAPSGYTNLLTRRAGNTWNNTLSLAFVVKATAGSENPGAFTHNTPTQGGGVAFTIALRAAGNSTAPLAPSASIVGGVGIVQYNTSDFEPHPDDPTDTHQTTTYHLSSSPTFGTLEVDEELGDPNKTDFQAPGIAAGTWYGRVRHNGENFDGDWSDVIEVIVTAQTVGDTPTTTLVDNGTDFVEVETSVYTHPDGAVEPPDYDPEDPHPYHVSTLFQAELQSDPDWDDPLFSIEKGYDGTVDSRRHRFSGLTAGTPYKFRTQQIDNFGAQTAFSSDLLQTTNATPAEAPLAPTITLDCGRDIVVSGSTYQHSDTGPGTAHAKTEARISYSGSAESIIIDDPVTEFTWPDVPPGLATLSMRYGDDSVLTRWGPYSNLPTCLVPNYPSQVRFTNPTTLKVSSSLSVTWVFEDTSIAWLSNIERSNGTGAFFVVASNQVAQSTPFLTGSLPDGTYTFRVAAVNPTTGEVGEFAYIPITLSRAGSSRRVFHRNAEQLALNGGGGRRIWDDTVNWTGLSEGEIAKGLLATRTGNGTMNLRSGWVFDTAGQLHSGDVIVGLVHRPDECEWPPWRFANPQVTRGGPMVLADGEIEGSRWGHATMLETPAQPWWLHPDMQCATNVYRTGAGAQTAKQSAMNLNKSFQYGRAGVLGKLRSVTHRNGQGTPDQASASLGSSTSPRIGGPFVSTFGIDSEVFIHKEVRPATVGGNAGWNIRSRFLGAGISDAWTPTVFVRQTDASGDTIECGACGFAFQDMEEIGVGRSVGILFTSITIIVESTGTCEPLEEECLSGITLNRILSIRRGPAGSDIEYFTIGSVPCPEET